MRRRLADIPDEQHIRFHVCRSQWHPDHYALSIEDLDVEGVSTRIAGADAGPWTVVETFTTTMGLIRRALGEKP